MSQKNVAGGSRSLLALMDSAVKGSDMDLCIETERLATFKDWPRTSPSLAPENMAAAGFYYVGKKGSDDVRCFCCFRELSEWEDDDDPWKEHAKRQGCFFAEIGKRQGELTFAEYLQVLAERERNRIKQWQKQSDQLSKIRNMLEETN